MISSTEVTKLKRSIYQAFAIKIVLIFTLLALSSFFSYQFIYQQKLKNLTTSATLSLNTVDSLIHNNFNFMESQVQQFVADSELHRYLITHNDLSKQFVLNSWQTIAERLKWFSKIELFSFSGSGNLRIDYDYLYEQATLPDDISYETKRFNRNKSKLTNQKRLHVSEIQLQKEFNEPIYPLTPIIKISNIIYITDERAEGILEASILVNKLLEPIKHSKKLANHNMLLVNKAGFYIKAENEEEEWGGDFQSKRHHNFATSFPILWQKMLTEEQGVLIKNNDTYIFKALSFKNTDEAIDYLLIDKISASYLDNTLYQQRMQLYIFHGILFLVLSFALWYSHSHKLSKKIQQHTLNLVSVLFNSGDAIFIINDNWQITTINSEFIKLTSYSSDKILNTNIQKHLIPALTPEKIATIEKTIVENGLWRDKLFIQTSTDKKIPCLLSIAPVKNDLNKISHYVTHIIDITAQETIEEQLKLAAIALETKAGIVITDPFGVIQRVNSSFTEITGYSSADALGKKPDILSSGKHSPEFFSQMWHDITTKGHWEGEIWNKRKDGEIYPQWSTITCIKNSKNIIKNYVSTFHDITIRKQLEQKLESMASTDPLTGSLNRRSFESRFNEEVSTAKRYHKTFGLMIFDIDHFKLVNDNYGHDQGDQILIQIVKRANATLREADILARWGGEEFVVLLPLNNIDETLLAAERLRNAFKSMDSTPQITCSFGITSYQVGDDFTSIVKRADTALYRAKETGRDRVILARETL